MITKFKKTFLLVAILATFTSGCKSTDDYKKFADAGNAFANANNILLDTAKDVAINTTSERVLSDRISQGLKPSDEVTKKFVERYNSLSKLDKDRLELIQELRRHNNFLQAYFNKLLELANSKSPERTQTAAENIASQLQNSGAKLINLGPVKLDKLPSVTKIVLDARIRGAIRDELEKRKEIIYREITIQEKLLDVISDSMENDIKITRDLQEYRLVLKPLLVTPENINDENAWIETRNKVMTQDAEIIVKIDTASKNFKAFKEIFIASVEGKVTSKSLNKFIQETNSFSKLVINK